MREILFRGKQKDKGEWVEGFYCPVCFGYFPCQPAIFPKEEVNNGCWRPVKVDPETVGQYTGLTDKNGKKIFEGDIVMLNVKGHNTVCTVSWAENVAQFQLWQINTIPNTSTALNLGNYDCKIIGNIYDTPELLEVKK